MKPTNQPTNPSSLLGMFGNQRTADIVVSQCVCMGKTSLL